MDISPLIAAQRGFFATGATLPIAFRRAALSTLYSAISQQEGALLAALGQDLNKSPHEGYLCEVGLARSELSFIQKRLTRWVAPRRVPTPLSLFPGKSFVVQQPYGVALIMSPWNYPLLLTLAPLIGAIAAGNCCIIKPSEDAPATAAAVAQLIAQCFPPEYITVLQGGREVSQALLQEQLDYIFFTGGTQTGRQVMAQAARYLTPITLELGGKSPCVVDATAKLDLAAKRLVFGKLLNCGQTCVAPDYLLIDRRVKEEFLARVIHWITQLYGTNPLDAQGYVSMINRSHFQRVCALIDPKQVVYGGKWDASTLKIQPTILDGVAPTDPVMAEEIFGPLLPVLSFDDIAQAKDFILQRPKPLSLYLFSQDKATVRQFSQQIPFGGGCINDTMLHLTNPHLPFGGVGGSGMGSYHGKASFNTFSHEKILFYSSTRIDQPLRYPPYHPWKQFIARQFLK